MPHTITKIFHFHAAHYLPYHEGVCNQLHGHTYKLEVTIKGRLNKGMVMDFSELKDIVNKAVIEKLDHKLLNEVFPNPTAESMSVYIHEQLFEVFKERKETLLKVKLWETQTSCAEYSR